MIVDQASGSLGRLGNQMFQLAAAIGLATYHDTSWARLNDSDLSEAFKLPNTKKATNEDRSQFSFKGEHNFHFDESPHGPPFFDWPDNIRIQGYFQSEKHFHHCKEIVREEFTFKDHILTKAINERNKLGDAPLVSVHIRRGDYKNNDRYHPILDFNYYDFAIRGVKEKLNEECNLVFFSDEPEWVKINMVPRYGGQVLHGHKYDDISLMTQCDHHIIGNSSYSWWGAWLGRNPNKLVVSPSYWFGPAYKVDTSDIHCEGWIVLPKELSIPEYIRQDGVAV